MNERDKLFFDNTFKQTHEATTTVMWYFWLILLRTSIIQDVCSSLIGSEISRLKRQSGSSGGINPMSPNDINVGVLLPNTSSYQFAIERMMGAVNVAVEKVTSMGLLKSRTMHITYKDTKGVDGWAMYEAINFHGEHVNALIGPVIDYSLAPVARQAKYWNLPVLTVGGVANEFHQYKLKYSSLTHTGPFGAHSLALYFISMSKTYRWSRLKFFYEQCRQETIPYFCHFSKDRFVYKLRRNNITVTEELIGNKCETVSIDEKLIKNAVVVLCASRDSVRDIMIKADELGFTKGEYVFFNIDLFSSKNESERPWYRATDTDARNQQARRAYEALMTVTLRKPDSPEYKNFSEEVKRRAQKQFGNFTYGEEEVNSFVGAFHDAVILYAIALNETIAAGGNATDGAEITKRMWNRTFEGITGTVSIDANGDRNADYSLLDLNPKTDKFEVVANYYGNKKVYEPVPGKAIHWAGGRDSPPPDTPECGFDGSGCPAEEKPSEGFPPYAIVIIVSGSLFSIVAITAFFVSRHLRLQAEISEVKWRVKWDDIMFGSIEKRKLERTGSRQTLRVKSGARSNNSGDTLAAHLSDIGTKQVFTKTGYYKGLLVAIKKITKTSININKPLLMEFKRMRDLQNDHIVRFIGVCIDPPNQCILTEYCQKGSLQDVLENDQITLDSMFKFSLMQDIVRGMAYLHSSEVRSHGNLKSSNCVVDSRFVLKITDFGLHTIRYNSDCCGEDPYTYLKGKLWTAPELLRVLQVPPEGTPKGDVYSFAIICQEIVYRNGAFWVEGGDNSPQEIYEKVKNGIQPIFRPTLDHFDNDDCSEELANMIKKCWAEDPLERPDFHQLKSMIRKINKEGDSGNILDNLLSRMEQYANNLESLVEERTSDFLEQKKRAEDLLYLMLPKSVAGQLMRGQSVTAERFSSCTIYFSDICGFTSLSSESTPEQVVDLLNDLYTTFDSIIDNFDVYKVETIGDAYMVVSGLPMRNGNLHAREISRMALALRNAVFSFKIRHKPEKQLLLRIGIHSGPVVAGVVGLKMPRYCLFGDTVNTASRMESNGLELKIHLSPYTKEILDDFGNFKCVLRGPVDMKGKGTITTFWLEGEMSSEFPDFNPDMQRDSITSMNSFSVAPLASFR